MTNKKHHTRRSGLLLGMAAALALTAVGATVEAGPPTNHPIESAYEEAGEWSVSTGSTTDASGATYELFYPTDLGAGGYDHPIITWGNGTGGTPDNYAEMLTHFASWGFVVVASTSGETGLGTEIVAGADWMTELNDTPSSDFYQVLDPSRIGAAGHSQGAGGAANATVLADGGIASTLTFNLPDPVWWTTPLTVWSEIDTPILFFTGSLDFLATPFWQADAYNKVSGPAAKATLGRAGHNEVHKKNNGFLGYATAWFRYTLADDATAVGAFVGDPPEINTNESFFDQAQRSLPATG